MQEEAPLVVFVEDNSYGLASVTDSGPDGLTTLAAIFQRLGARTNFVRLDEAIPEEARVVILVRPRRPLPVDFLAHLWVHIEKGNSFLLALDSPGHLTGEPDPQNSGLDRLLTWDYGVSLLTGFVSQPTFTLESIASLPGSLIETEASTIPNPIIDPISRYELPVRMWGARALLSEQLGVTGRALPLLNVDGFAETTTQVFRTTDPAALEVNIGSDPQGSLVVGAVSQNDSIGARIAVLGDSESVMNGFGLAGSPALNPGNLVLAQQLAAWLLELPEESWLPLPSEFTWLQIDGSRSDWTEIAPTTPGPNSDPGAESLNIREVRAFKDQDFLYLLIDTLKRPDPNVQLEIEADLDVDGMTDVRIVVDVQTAFISSQDGTELTIPDARVAVGESIEVRLPLRITGISSRIPILCLKSSVELASPVSNCMGASISVGSASTQAPQQLSRLEGLDVTVTSDIPVNVRTEPSMTSIVLGLIDGGNIFKATGRNQAGDWIFVQNARYGGWIASYLLIANGDLQSLPIIN